MKPTYADPTAWTAIANIERNRKVTHKSPTPSGKGADRSVWFAPEAKLREEKVTLIRPENRDIFTMLRRELDENTGSSADI